jgi:hypothetical protein
VAAVDKNRIRNSGFTVAEKWFLGDLQKAANGSRQTSVATSAARQASEPIGLLASGELWKLN